MEILRKNSVKYALYMCVILAACLMYMEATGQNESFEKVPAFSVVMFLSPAVIWFLGIRAKKRMQKGKLTFKEGVKEGFLISLAFAIISPFLFLAYYLLINPDIIEYVKTAYNMRSTPNSVVIAADMAVQFISAIIFGTIYAAIISFFLKTKASK